MVCTWFALQPMSFFVWMKVAKSIAYRQETKIFKNGDRGRDEWLRLLNNKDI